MIADAVRPRRPAFRSVAAITAWRLNAGERLQVEINDDLQSLRRGGVAQRVRQGLKPSGIASLQGKQLGHGVVPAL